jgi:hypothetical protein
VYSEPSPSADASAASLLPAPTTTPQGSLLLDLLIASALASRRANRALQDAKTSERRAAEREETKAIEDQASNTLVTGMISAGMKIGAGAAKLESSLQSVASDSLRTTANDADQLARTNADQSAFLATQKAFALHLADDHNASAARWGMASAGAEAGSGFVETVGAALGKELEADAKKAVAKAGDAKDAGDAAAERAREERDLVDAILRAAEVLTSSGTANVTTLLSGLRG